MSALRLYWPQPLSLYSPDDTPCAEHEDDPVILSFHRVASRLRCSGAQDALSRSRLVHENQCCPACGRAAVEIIDDAPLLMLRDQMPVPGSGNLLGFRCGVCCHEWDG